MSDTDLDFKSLEIAIPVLNEVAGLEHSVKTLLDFAASSLANFDVGLVIANNGSTDGTLALAQRLAASDAVRVVSTPEAGVGKALKLAWDTSAADIVGFLDVDLATDLRHLEEMLEAFKSGADIVVGSRLLPESVVVNRRGYRELMSRIFNALVRHRAQVRISDAMCGFKFGRASVVSRCRQSGACSDGWFFSAELLLAGKMLGHRVVEMPVSWVDDRQSKVKLTQHPKQFVQDLDDFLGRFHANV